MENMKKAFECYFKKLMDYSIKTYGAKPSCSYTDRLNKALLVSEPNEDKEVEWLPKLQDVLVIWKDIEDKLGFIVCDELKAYYSTYLFLSMAGKFGSGYLYFQPISSQNRIVDTIMQQYKDAQYIFPNTQMFLLGNATINDDDSYFIYYDNSTSKTFCYESDTKKQVLLSYSLAKTIYEMEALE